MSSRVARKPIPVPNGVDIKIEASLVKVKGSKGELTQPLIQGICVEYANNEITVKPSEGLTNGNALAGTTRALLSNHVHGVTNGFEKKLVLVGVGYRAQVVAAGKTTKLNLTLGLSHPVEYTAPEGIVFESPSATEIIVKGIEKHLVGQVAADIRNIRKGIRKPEPYKGKGIRYHDERIILKETKKK
ncbi:MAG: 50S ribosomal protein L6 [Candidatus Berkiella sp.]